MKLRLTILFTAVLAVIVLMVNYTKSSHEEIFTVDNTRVFNEFRMTIDTKRNGEKMLKDYDSNIGMLTMQYNAAKEERIKQQIFEQLSQQKDDYQRFSMTYTNEATVKIWQRINEYIKEYAKIKNARMILGSSGNGAVFYSEGQQDITQDVLNFINQKYEGSN
ncbi:OmpH family outer membrane protein [Flavobacterium sp. 3HN19-14]|uniref:OmpH family outer membrane protein n=1 Tax=Flavobacterium sp. 3HN19-14 TaxID=3448133 RepID=UPI003EE30A26